MPREVSVGVEQMSRITVIRYTIGEHRYEVEFVSTRGIDETNTEHETRHDESVAQYCQQWLDATLHAEDIVTDP
jgi:hypothetical protein